MREHLNTTDIPHSNKTSSSSSNNRNNKPHITITTNMSNRHNLHNLSLIYIPLPKSLNNEMGQSQQSRRPWDRPSGLQRLHRLRQVARTSPSRLSIIACKSPSASVLQVETSPISLLRYAISNTCRGILKFANG